MSNLRQKNKIVKKGFDPKNGVEFVLECLKNSNYERALQYSMNCMDKPQKLQFLILLLEKSKYRAYYQSLENFKRIVNTFIESKDEKVLLKYLEYLDSLDSNSEFDSIKKSIIASVVNKKYDSNGYFAVLDILNLDVFEIEPRQWTSIICDICSINWPENKALKLLYG